MQRENRTILSKDDNSGIQLVRMTSSDISHLEALQIAADKKMRLPTLLELANVLRSDKYYECMSALPAASSTNAAIPEKGGCLLAGGKITDMTDSYFPNHVLLAEDVRKAAQKGDLSDPARGLAIVYTVAFVEPWGEKTIYHPSEIFVQEVARGKGGQINSKTGLAQPVPDEEFDTLNWADQAWYFGPDGLINRPIAAGNSYFGRDCWFRLADGGRLGKGFGVVGVPLLPKLAAGPTTASLVPSASVNIAAGSVPSAGDAAAGQNGADNVLQARDGAVAGQKEENLAVPAHADMAVGQNETPGVPSLSAVRVSVEGTRILIDGLPPHLLGLFALAAAKGFEMANDPRVCGSLKNLQALLEAFQKAQSKE